MTAHRIDNAGALGERPVPIAHPLGWASTGHFGWHDSPDYVFLTKTFQAKWQHQYLITGCLSGIGMVFQKAIPRTFYATVEGVKVWDTQLGSIHDGGPANSLVETGVPIFATWTAPDDRLAATLVVGMKRGADQDWELGEGTHNVHVIDLGCLAVR